MDIGNVKMRPHYSEKEIQNKTSACKNRQMQKDIANNTCFVCHGKGCREALRWEIQDRQCRIWKCCFSLVGVEKWRVTKLKGPLKRKECTLAGPEKKSALTRVSTTTEPDKIGHTENRSIYTDDFIPVTCFIVLSATCNNVLMKVVNGDGCITNVVSRWLVEWNRYSFKPGERKCDLQHFKERSTEVSSKVLPNGTFQIGSHIYKSTWVVTSSRYDVLLGMSGHVANRPKIN